MDRAFTAAAAALVATFMLAWVSAKDDASANVDETAQPVAHAAMQTEF